MVTYNVKQAADILNIDSSYVYVKLRVLGINKIKGRYHLDQDTIDILKVPYNNKVNHFEKLRNVALNLGIPIDHPKIEEALSLRKTGFYTYKGIKHILGL